MDGTSHIGGTHAAGGARVENDPASRARIQRAAQDFEALFIGYLIKSMRAAAPSAEDGGGFGGEMMESLADMQFAQHMSRSQPLGIANMVYRSVTGEQMPAAPRRHAARPLPPGALEQPPGTCPVREGAAEKGPGSAPADATRTASADHVATPAGAGGIPQAAAERINMYAPYIRQAAKTHSVDPDLIRSVIAAESGGRPTAVSSRKARGLMQLIDSTAREMGVRNVLDPKENIQGGTRYLKELLDRFAGDVRKALAGYNAGPGAVTRYNGVPPYPETLQYIENVMRYFEDFKQQKDGVDGNE